MSPSLASSATKAGVVLFFLFVETGVFQTKNVAVLHGGDGLRSRLTDAVIGESDRPLDHLRQRRGDRLERFLRVTPLGPAEMREQDYLAALAGDFGDGRCNALEAGGVGDTPALHGHVEVDAQQDAFALYVDVVEGTELFCHWRLARAHPSRRLASLGSSG